MRSIGLLSLAEPGHDLATWAHGPHRTAPPDVAAVAEAIEAIEADAILCLDAAFPRPDVTRLHALLDGPCDVWHAGLRLGLAGQPRALEHVYPQWMLTTPVDPEIESTSPCLTLRALLFRTGVVDQLGGPDQGMDTLTGAGLELGIRWTRAGALTRHVPWLAPTESTPCAEPTERDGIRCVARHHGRTWAFWALARSTSERAVPLRELRPLAAAARASEPVRLPDYEPMPTPPGDPSRSVSVILPTIDRYPYLEPLLEQLATQTAPPHQVIVVDQTPKSRRRDDLAAVAPELPLTVITLDAAGQSTARNTALAEATGEFVLFIDDDDEIPNDLLAQHLARLTDGVDAVCGGVDDATAGPPPPGFRHRRASDVFPTNNTMLRRTALRGSGLFDPAFDHGPRADRDLGVRLQRSGAVMVYDPSVMVFHHHAPMGGLRTHGARVVTRAGARRSLTTRNLPSVTETYLGLRYYTPHQQREARAVRIMSILSASGSRTHRVLRAVVQLGLLPDTLRQIHRTEEGARAMLASRPPIPRLEDDPTPWWSA